MTACCPILIALVAAASAEPLTLQETLDRAVRANLELRQDRLVLQRSEMDIEAARGGFDPSIWAGLDRGGVGAPDDPDHSASLGFSTGLTQGLTTGGSASLAWYGAHERGSEADAESHDNQLYLGLNQPLLQGSGRFAARYEIREAQRNHEYQALAYRAAKEELVLAAAAAYWSVVAARETLAIADRSLAIAEQQLDETRERRAEGFAALGDELQVERAVYTALQARVVARTRLADAEVQLLRLLGHDLDRRPPLELVDRPIDPEEPPDLQLSLDIAREYNARWLQQRLLVQGAAEALQLARNNNLPSLDLSGSVGLAASSDQPREARTQVFSDHQPAWTMGLTLSMPIPGRAEDLEVDQAWLGSLESRLAMEAAEQDLIQRVESAVRAVERDTERVRLARRTVEIARAALQADQELVSEGRGSTRELVRSLESLDAAQVTRLRAEIDLQVSVLALKKVEGLLLTKLGLEGG
jgi:outer membrane protein